MTIFELYRWAKEKKAEDYDVIIWHRDCSGKYAEFDMCEAPEVLVRPSYAPNDITKRVVAL